MRTSGTSVNEELTSFPAEISFPIIDDDVALETVERYSLSLIPSDPLVIINQATSEIVILENDGKLHRVTRFVVYIISYMRVFVLPSLYRTNCWVSI